MKFCPSLLSVKILNFGFEYLQNYSVDLNHMWYVGTCPQDLYKSQVTTPVDLFVKSGTGVKLAYSISYIYQPIATESCRKVYYNTRNATIGSETPVCLYKKSGAGVKFTNSQNMMSYISVPNQSI